MRVHGHSTADTDAAGASAREADTITAAPVPASKVPKPPAPAVTVIRTRAKPSRKPLRSNTPATAAASIARSGIATAHHGAEPSIRFKCRVMANGTPSTANIDSNNPRPIASPRSAIPTNPADAACHSPLHHTISSLTTDHAPATRHLVNRQTLDHSAIAPGQPDANIRCVILPVIFLAAAAIAACGLLGAPTLPTGQAAPFVAGALALAGAFVICALFAIRSRWHGIGGATVVALAGCARNADACFALLQSAATSRPAPPGEAYRAAIAVICLGLFMATARTIHAERRRRQSMPTP